MISITPPDDDPETILFDPDGKIAEHWRLRQPFTAFWVYSGSWNARSVF